jgi:hypothetical protein
MPVPFKELTIAFGDYVEAYEGTDNTSEARSAACMALCPAGSSSGSWILWKMNTCMRVHHNNFHKLVTMELVISVMNTIAQQYEHKELKKITAEITEQQRPEVVPQVGIPQENHEENQGESQAGDQEEN